VEGIRRVDVRAECLFRSREGLLFGGEGGLGRGWRGLGGRRAGSQSDCRERTEPEECCCHESWKGAHPETVPCSSALPRGLSTRGAQQGCRSLEGNMAHLLGAEALHLEYPTKVVFDSVTIGIEEGDRIGIVGRNGDGKSSLLAMLAGRREPD